MIFMLYIRLVVNLFCWGAGMAISSYYIIFKNQYWAIMTFFVFLALFILTIKEHSNARRKA